MNYVVKWSLMWDSSAHQFQKKKNEPLKCSRGSQKKTKGLVMIESEYVDQPKKRKKSRKIGPIKMKVIEDLKAHIIASVVEECGSTPAHAKTDDSTSCVRLSNKVEQPISKVIPKNDINKELLWVHITISNSKGWLLSNFHKINKEYLQYYLDEFCYNFNRRYLIDNLFD